MQRHITTLEIHKKRYGDLLISILFLYLLSLMIFHSPVIASSKGTTPDDLARVDDARDIYQTNCAACHGFDGSPIMAGVPNFSRNERLDMSDQELLSSISNGKASTTGGVAMPPWKGILDENEMAITLQFVRVIKGDAVFQDNCLSCHNEGVPAVPEAIRKIKSKLDAHQGPFNLCKGTDTDGSMERQNIIDAINFLIGITKNDS